MNDKTEKKRANKSVKEKPPQIMKKPKLPMIFEIDANTLHSRAIIQPPKLLPKVPRIRSIFGSVSSKAKATPIGDHSQLDPSYDKDSNQTYLNQMFNQLFILGEGSFGEVSLCQSRVDNKKYAIKSIGKFMNRNKFQEVLNLDKIRNNAFCVNYINAWTEESNLFIQFEPALMSLTNFKKQFKFLVLKQCMFILQDMCKALQYLHFDNLCHCDIKPDNILAMTDGSYKLCDFDLLKEANEKLLDLGDSKYVALEVMNSSVSSTKGDIFSLGMTMLELKVGYDPPQNDDNWHTIRTAVQKVLINSTESRYPSKYSVIVDWMMHPEPNNRPSASDLLKNPYVASFQESHLERVNYVKVWVQRIQSNEKENSVIIDLSGESEMRMLSEANSTSSPSTPSNNVTKVVLVNASSVRVETEKTYSAHPVKLF